MLKHFILERYSLIDLVWILLTGVVLGNGHPFISAWMFLLHFVFIVLQYEIGKKIGVVYMGVESRNNIINKHFSKKPE